MEAKEIARYIGGYLGAFVIIAFIASVLLGVANSNLIWGEDDQYAHIDIPGTQVVHLPARTVEAAIAVALPGRGNDTPNLLLPKDLGLSLRWPDDARKPKISMVDDGSVNASDHGADTQRHVWNIRIYDAGDYRFRVRGDFTGYGVNSQLWLGYQPGFLHGTSIWLAGALVALVVMLLGAVVVPRVRGRGRATLT